MARPESRTTWAAIGLAAAITVPYVIIFVQTIRAIVDPDSVSEEALREIASIGALPQGDQLGVAFSYLAGVIGAVIVVVLAVLIGVAARRQPAREAGFAVFGTIAVIAGASGIGGLLTDSPPSGSWLGAVTSLACIGVVVLLALESTTVDFELAETERRRRRDAH